MPHDKESPRDREKEQGYSCKLYHHRQGGVKSFLWVSIEKPWKGTVEGNTAHTLCTWNTMTSFHLKWAGAQQKSNCNCWKTMLVVWAQK